MRSAFISQRMVKRIFILLLVTGIVSFMVCHSLKGKYTHRRGDVMGKPAPRREDITGKPAHPRQDNNDIHNYHGTDTQLPIEQCPKRFKNCSERVILRNRNPKWIALWLPTGPQEDVSHLTKIPGWKTVVIGDGVCPRGCRYPRCVFLDPASQIALGSSLAALLPPNDPVKKNIAYLYAIKQRAEYIYDTDVSIRPLHNLTDFFYGNTSGLVYTGGGVFNYYKHYGEHWYLLKGFMSIDENENDLPAFILSNISQPEVQQGLVKIKDGPGPRFQSVVPLVFVGSHSFAPFGSRNTMFSRRVFWGLFTFPGLNSEILRAYCLQALLRYIQGFVGFLHPNAYETADSQITELTIPKELVKFLYEWECRDNADLSTCFSQLASDMVSRSSIKSKDLRMTIAWLTDLLLFDYKVADIHVKKPLKLKPKTNRPEPGSLNTTVEFSPSPRVYYKNNPDVKTYNLITTLCENFAYPPHVPYLFDDIILIITFFKAFFYENIPYIEALYRRYFPHILLCGPDSEYFRSAVKSLPVNSSVAYVDGIERGWMYFQECTIYAMQMNFNAKGYLQIGDDTLVNPWKLKTLSKDQLWFVSLIRKTSRSIQPDKRYIWWWDKSYGTAGINMTFEHIETVAKKPDDSLEKRFYNQYVTNIGNFNTIFHQASDFFYIPNRLKEEFIYVNRLFINSTTVIEAAMPTMIFGLDPIQNITRVRGLMIWGQSRANISKFYDEEAHYYHAFKGRVQMKQPIGKRFMCERFLPTLVNRMNQDESHKRLA